MAYGQDPQHDRNPVNYADEEDPRDYVTRQRVETTVKPKNKLEVPIARSAPGVDSWHQVPCLELLDTNYCRHETGRCSVDRCGATEPAVSTGNPTIVPKITSLGTRLKQKDLYELCWLHWLFPTRIPLWNFALDHYLVLARKVNRHVPTLEALQGPSIWQEVLRNGPSRTSGQMAWNGMYMTFIKSRQRVGFIRDIFSFR